jgi:hypothetical protein
MTVIMGQMYPNAILLIYRKEKWLNDTIKYLAGYDIFYRISAIFPNSCRLSLWSSLFAAIQQDERIVLQYSLDHVHPEQLNLLQDQ